jgi:hypothetical protein
MTTASSSTSCRTSTYDPTVKFVLTLADGFSEIDWPMAYLLVMSVEDGDAIRLADALGTRSTPAAKHLAVGALQALEDLWTFAQAHGHSEMLIEDGPLAAVIDVFLPAPHLRACGGDLRRVSVQPSDDEIDDADTGACVPNDNPPPNAFLHAIISDSTDAERLRGAVYAMQLVRDGGEIDEEIDEKTDAALAQAITLCENAERVIS